MKTVLITGAGRGFGKALAEAFRAAEYETILHCFTSVITGPECPVVQGDLRDPETLNALYRACVESGLDVLVNNAGVRIAKPFDQLSCKDICDMLSINLAIPIVLTNRLWPLFNKGATIVNVNSLAGKGVGVYDEVAYAASKMGLTGFSQTLRYSATTIGVRVINVCLGAMKTDMTEGRSERDKFIDPAEAAWQVVRLCEESHSTFQIPEVEISRRTY
jgi:NAD(P)-dependent dehydrogenase (short-subunit alcohol dehydrogenase family)